MSDKPHGTLICQHCGSVQCGTLDLRCDGCNKPVFALNLNGLNHIDFTNCGIEFNRLLDAVEQVIEGVDDEDNISNFATLKVLENALKYYRNKE